MVPKVLPKPAADLEQLLRDRQEMLRGITPLSPDIEFRHGMLWRLLGAAGGGFAFGLFVGAKFLT